MMRSCETPNKRNRILDGNQVTPVSLFQETPRQSKENINRNHLKVNQYLLSVDGFPVRRGFMTLTDISLVKEDNNNYNKIIKERGQKHDQEFKTSEPFQTV